MAMGGFVVGGWIGRLCMGAWWLLVVVLGGQGM